MNCQLHNTTTLLPKDQSYRMLLQAICDPSFPLDLLKTASHGALYKPISTA